MGSSWTNRVRHRGKDAEIGGSFGLRGTKTVSGEGGTCGLADFGRYHRTQKAPPKTCLNCHEIVGCAIGAPAAAYRRGAPCLLLPS